MRNLFSILAMALMLILASCGNNPSSDSANDSAATNEVAVIQDDKFDLSPQEFGEKMNALQDAPVIDVRTPREFAGGILNRAVNVDWNGSDFAEQIFKYDKNSPIFVYCLSGARSASAAAMMRQGGFKKVYELKGGVMKWNASGFKLLDESEGNGGMTKAEYEKLLSADKPVLVDFYADWCSPCKKMEPYLEEIKNEMTGKAEVIRIDVDANRALCKELGVDRLPVLILYKKGKEVWSKKALAEKSELTTAILNAL